MAIMTVISSSSSRFLTTLAIQFRNPSTLPPSSSSSHSFSSSSCIFCSFHHTNYPPLASTSGRQSSSNRSAHLQMDPMRAASSVSSASTAVDIDAPREEGAEFDRNSEERNHHFVAMAEEVLQLILAAEEVCSVDETSGECAAAWDEVQARLRIVASNPPSSIN